MDPTFVDWITLAVQALAALATATLAWMVYSWTQKAQRNEVTRTVQNDWRTYNLTVLGDADLLALEARNHLHSGLSEVETKKMCLYFIKLNVPYNMWIASQQHLLEPEDVAREVHNQARLLRHDQTFIERNVFPRGYHPDFCTLFREEWGKMTVTSPPAPASPD